MGAGLGHGARLLPGLENSAYSAIVGRCGAVGAGLGHGSRLLQARKTLHIPHMRSRMVRWVQGLGHAPAPSRVENSIPYMRSAAAAALVAHVVVKFGDSHLTVPEVLPEAKSVDG